MDPTAKGTLEERHYRTPAWLDQSFVLPAVRVPRPRDGSPAREAEFVRPPHEEVDFVRVVRRTDTCQRARQTSSVALLAALTLLAAFVATASPVTAVLALVAAAVATSAMLVRLVLRTAPVPHRHE